MTKGTGARPSSGAATPGSPRVSYSSSAILPSRAAAPEDGRAPGRSRKLSQWASRSRLDSFCRAAALLVLFATAAGTWLVASGLWGLRHQFRQMGESIDRCPKWALRADGTERIIDSFFVGTAKNPVADDGFFNSVLFKERG